jgi:hypothetical protein
MTIIGVLGYLKMYRIVRLLGTVKSVQLVNVLGFTRMERVIVELRSRVLVYRYCKLVYLMGFRQLSRVINITGYGNLPLLQTIIRN